MDPTDGNPPQQDAAPEHPVAGPPQRRIELSRQELETILQHAKAALSEQEFATLQGAVETLAYLTTELEKKHVSLQRLRQMLFGAPTETTAQVLKQILEHAGKEPAAAADAGAAAGTTEPGAAEKPKGHGRHGADAYRGAKTIHVPLTGMKAGDAFPAECLHVLEILKDVYHNDAIAKGRGMSPEERLRFHQAQSGPRMAELQAWMETQITQRKVEPNSGLGEAIAYMRKHWDKLTLFLRVPGAPLDNNVCERALKKAILHRKNALYYKTQNGARVGDLFMSLIHTCELNGANPFHYLTELQKHARELAATPADWMPWNYHHALESGQSRPAG